MYNVIGVKFDSLNNISYVDVNKNDLKKGDKVIVELDNVLDYGVCVTSIKNESKDNISFPLMKVLRKANKNDMLVIDENNNFSEKALIYAKELSKKMELNMNFVSACYTFDKSQLYFNFISDERVDFRELAKKLAQKYKTRIELRQIGVRDKAKLIGGLGPCGLFLCCKSFLTDFNSVSINMAKNQFLALNPSKINGVCGRLLCCLNYEDEVYTELKEKLPKIGSTVTIDEGTGKVVGVNVFKNSYQVELSKYNIVEVDGDK